MPSVLFEILVKSYDEKGFEFGVGASSEIPTLVIEFNVEHLVRDPISFEFLHLVVLNLKTMCAFNRQKFDTVSAEMKPSATVIDHVTCTEHFM